jgi:hypothetical protein
MILFSVVEQLVLLLMLARNSLELSTHGIDQCAKGNAENEKFQHGQPCLIRDEANIHKHGHMDLDWQSVNGYGAGLFAYSAFYVPGSM